MSRTEKRMVGAIMSRNWSTYSSSPCPPVIVILSAELREAIKQLKAQIGESGYYDWACTLPTAIKRCDSQYCEAVKAKLVEVSHQVACSKDSTVSEAQS
jgi:hypothetical protein